MYSIQTKIETKKSALLWVWLYFSRLVGNSWWPYCNAKIAVISKFWRQISQRFPSSIFLILQKNGGKNKKKRAWQNYARHLLAVWAAADAHLKISFKYLNHIKNIFDNRKQKAKNTAVTISIIARFQTIFYSDTGSAMNEKHVYPPVTLYLFSFTKQIAHSSNYVCVL